MQWVDRKKISQQYIEMCAEDKRKALAKLVPGEAPNTGGSSSSGAGPASAGAITLHRPILRGITGRVVMFLTCFAACAGSASARLVRNGHPVSAQGGHPVPASSCTGASTHASQQHQQQHSHQQHPSQQQHSQQQLSPQQPSHQQQHQQCAGAACADAPEPIAPAMPVRREVSRKAERKHRFKNTRARLPIQRLRCPTRSRGGKAIQPQGCRSARQRMEASS